MIACIEGKLAGLAENACVILTSGGVGYEVNLSAPTFSRLPAQGGETRFFTATVVREDSLELFGFESWDERQVFLVLISIARVGPRTAMSILSVFSPDDLRRLIAADDVLALTRVSGIGKKTGQQIFLDLKYKLKGEASAVATGYAAKPDGVLSDTVAGLINLGYDEEQAVNTVKRVLDKEKDLDVSGALRAALKTLARSRA
ncbi:MAG: Holliday junction branch migration protein RuvA [Desulfovibrio sp.]|jgi:Holliday junction DNA helicase RuvA|nr:Holliday junction branch migration protein RuvA [Desulfovibrio sp.]